MKELLSVNLGTEHKLINIKKVWYFIFTILFKFIFLGIGITIGYYICFNCLFCKDCNDVVTAYLSLVSLACLLNFGLPIDKLINLKF